MKFNSSSIYCCLLLISNFFVNIRSDLSGQLKFKCSINGDKLNMVLIKQNDAIYNQDTYISNVDDYQVKSGIYNCQIITSSNDYNNSLLNTTVDITNDLVQVSKIVFECKKVKFDHYTCIARNNEILQRDPRDAVVELNGEKPSFMRKPQSNKYSLNSKVELICEAKGTPEPQIEWYKDGSSEILRRGSIFVIQNVKIEDQGEYKCKAYNIMGTIEAKAKINVYEKPSFVKTLPNYTFGFETKSLMIECNARGYPQPVIYWAKSTNSDLGKSNQNSQDDFIILENGNLFIERLSKKYEGTYLCQANNDFGSIEMKTVLQVKQIQTKPPPIISFEPQNQTIPLNTQAILECKTASIETKPIIIWYKGNQVITNQQYETRKYNLEDSGSLVINSVQRSDSDLYKCVVTTSFGQTTSTNALLKVEDPNDQSVEFKRNYDTTALPSSCGQPTVLSITSNSIQLTWQPSSYSGRSKLVAYRIEYFSPEWSRNSLGWVILVDDIPAHTNFYTVSSLQPDTYYLFIVRARNEQGYGPPSPVSDLVKTLFEAQTHFREKNSNELLEKALNGDVIQLNDADVLSSTSLNITWKVLKSSYLIEGFNIKYKQIGSTNDYKIEKISDNKKRSHVLNNLLKFTAYEITIEPFSGTVHGSESNTIQIKTKEDVPDQSPNNLNVELETTTSVSIKWQPPSYNKINGIILGYKIHCIANETKFNIFLNTNSTTRAIILGNLIEGMKYCVKVAAYTKIGSGPFTNPPKCIEMAELNLVIKERTYAEKFRDIISEPWFIAVLTVLSIMTFILLCYCFWFIFRRIHKKRKSTSDNVLKTDNGNRYKLVNDGIWMDTLHSSNHSNQECCCVPDIHHQLFLQKQNNMTSLNSALHDLNSSLETRLNSSLRKTFLMQQQNNTSLSQLNTNSSNSTNKTALELQQQQQQQQLCTPLLKHERNFNNLSQLINSSNCNSNSSSSPQYAEIYSPNHYASTGLFNSTNTETTNNDNSDNTANNLDVSNTTNSTFILNSNASNNDKAQKSYLQQSNSKLQNPIALKYENIMNREVTEKELLKYLQATQSVTNTPRIPIKCLQSLQRVKSLENQNRHGIDHKASNNSHYQQQHTNTGASFIINQQTNIPPFPQTPVPALPKVPPPTNHLNEMDSYLATKNSYIATSPIHYNKPWNITTQGIENGNNLFNLPIQNTFNNTTPTLTRLTAHNTDIAQQQNYQVIDETLNNGNQLLLNHIYQQQQIQLQQQLQLQQQKEQYNQEQVNQIYKIISLSNDIAATLIRTNSLRLAGDLQSANVNCLPNGGIIIAPLLNKETNSITIDEGVRTNAGNNQMVQSWASTITENTNQVATATASGNTTDNSNSTTTISSSSNYSNNDDNENQYATYMSHGNIDNMQEQNSNTTHSYEIDTNKMYISEMVNIL